MYLDDVQKIYYPTFVAIECFVNIKGVRKLYFSVIYQVYIVLGHVNSPNPAIINTAPNHWDSLALCHRDMAAGSIILLHTYFLLHLNSSIFT